MTRADAPRGLRGAVGVGLRVPHLRHIFTHWPAVDFFEIISENFMVDGGPPLDNLARLLERYPVVKNNNAKNRAANRRVTIRLERDGL